MTSRIRRWIAGTAALLTALAALALAPPAGALANGDAGFGEALLRACPDLTGWAGPGAFGPARVCEIEEVVSDTFSDEPESQVGSTVYNCTPTPQRYQISWTRTTGTSNSVGVELTFGMEETAGPVKLKQEIKFKYDHSWSESSSVSETTTVDVPPFSQGWVSYARMMETSVVKYDVTFKNKVDGHWIWYPQDAVTTQAVDGGGNPRGAVTQHSQLMTPSEWQRRCPQYSVPTVQLRNAWFESRDGEGVTCAAVAGRNAVVAMSRCGDAASRWQAFPVGTDGAVTTYRLYNAAADACLDVRGGYVADARQQTTVHGYACDSVSPSQLWRAVPQTDGTVHLVNQRNALCADAYTDNRQIVLEPCVTWAANERWVLQR